MSEELNDNLALQNIVTLQLITSMNSLTIGLTVITSNFKITVAAMLIGFKSIKDETVDLSATINKVGVAFENLQGGIGLIGGAGSTTTKQNKANKALNALGNNIGNTFKSLSKSMLSLTFIMKPISGFLGGLLAPIDDSLEIFGAFGEILGVGLLPFTKEISASLISFLPWMSVLSSGLSVVSTGLGSVVVSLTTYGQSVADNTLALLQNLNAIKDAQEATEALRAELATERGKTLTRGGFAGKETGLIDL